MNSAADQSSSSSSVPVPAQTSVLLLEEDQKEELQQGFPKRWVIVILCFSAFLLCNMDRVSQCFLLLGLNFQIYVV